MGSKKSKKRKKRVRFPIDRNGTPIRIHDFMAFDDGIYRISSLTYMGEKYGWTAEADNCSAGTFMEFIDNLEKGVVLTKWS